MQFRLADSAANGNQVGQLILISDVPVNKGAFNVTLDFGPIVFDGSVRWLEIDVRTNQASGPYTVLQPLQPITGTPYAVFAASAATASLASNLVAGAVLTNLSLHGSSIQPGSITSVQIDTATDLAYRSVNTNVVAAILAATPLSIHGGSIEPGTITAVQIDPVTDAAYRNTDTNTISAIVASSFAKSAGTAGVASNIVAGAVLANISLHGSNIQAGTITAAQMDPGTDAAYRAVSTNVITAIVAGASANFATSSGAAGIASNLVAGVVATNLPYLDVKQVFGAKGDGNSDDTAVIQSALNYVGTDLASNATLYFPAGTYKILNTLSVPPTSFPYAPVPIPVFGSPEPG